MRGKFCFLTGALALAFAFASPAPAAETKSGKKAGTEKEALPFLGPGADKLSKDEYLRVYSQYIKESILMGFPPKICAESPCEQGLAQLFSGAGLFTYPIPSGGDVKTWKHSAGLLECYESGGTVAQVEREAGGALVRALAVLSKSPKAVAKVARACRQGPLQLERDAATGLERLAGVPVGYPHPLLCPESQGLIVRRLDFNKDRNACRPTNFQDNSWVSQLRLSNESCAATIADLKLALTKKIPPAEFAKRERERQRARVVGVVRERGGDAAAADAAWKEYYAGPVTHDVTMVGIAMRNVENCNQFHLGQTPAAPGTAGSETPPGHGESSKGKGAQGK